MSYLTTNKKPQNNLKIKLCNKAKEMLHKTITFFLCTREQKTKNISSHYCEQFSLPSTFTFKKYSKNK